MTYTLEEILAHLPELPTDEPRRSGSTAHLAGSHFNQVRRGGDILQRAGFILLRRDPYGDEHYHWPDSSNDVSATWYAEDNHTTIWSETAVEHFGCPIRRPMDAFGLFTFLFHRGDFHAAHDAAVAEGFSDHLELLVPEVASTPGELIVVTASEVIPRRVSWLWDGWLPVGKLVTLDGDPDAGKSTLMVDLAARLSSGASMPESGLDGRTAASVVFLSGEDDLDDTTVWRLKAAGADLRRIHHVQGVTRLGVADSVMVPRDLEALGRVVESSRAALVVVDVFDEYLDARVDSYRSTPVRQVLAQIRDMAKKTGAAVVLLRHLRKEAATKAIYRGMGSMAVVGAARAGWVLGYHPDDESVRVMAAVKMNLAPKPQPLTFKLLNSSEHHCAYVDWRGPIDLDADRLLNPVRETEDDTDKATRINECRQILRQILTDGREIDSEEVMAILRADPHKFHDPTIQTAKNREGVMSRAIREPGKRGIQRWMMWLPRSE